MQALDLNLASRPFKNDTLPWVGLVTAVLGLAVLTVWNIRTYRDNAHLAEDLRQQYATTRVEMEQFDGRERRAQRDIEGYNLEALTVRADKANEVIRWKAFSWTQLFNLLQEVLPYDAQMISIRPVFRPQAGSQRQKNRHEQGRVPVSVEGVAKNLDAFFELERALLAHPNFDRVDPGGHTQDRTRAVAFQLKFLYDPNPVVEAAELVEPVEEVEEAEGTEGAADGPVPDVAEAQPEDAAGIAEGEPEPIDTAQPPDPQAPLATGETAEAIPPAAEQLPSEEAGDPAAPSVAGRGDEKTKDDAPAPKKPGRRKSGKRRGGDGRGTEGGR